MTCDLYLGNCLDILPTIRQVDLIFTSPPYYNARDYAAYDSYKHYQGFLVSFMKLARQVLAPDGFFVLNTSPVIVERASRQSSSIRLPIPFDTFQIAQWCGFTYVDDIIWKKPDGASDRAIKFASHRRPCAYKPFPVTEYLFVFRRNDAPLIDDTINRHSPETIQQSLVADGYERTNVWEINPVTNADHPAPFPSQLANNVIRYYSYRDDTVLDPFMGSGTVAAECMKENRHFIGIDTNAAYVELAKRKIESL